jgi:hypothetical protein
MPTIHELRSVTVKQTDEVWGRNSDIFLGKMVIILCNRNGGKLQKYYIKIDCL